MYSFVDWSLNAVEVIIWVNLIKILPTPLKTKGEAIHGCFGPICSLFSKEFKKSNEIRVEIVTATNDTI